MATNTTYITAFKRSFTNGISAPRNFKTAISISVDNLSLFSEHLMMHL